MYWPFYHFMKLLVLVSWTGSASSISSPSSVSQERWERLENDISAQGSKPSGVCCGFFVWNVPSAICYHWGARLKDRHTTEGRGGIKYVRIDEKGLLKYFWPCSRFQPDACAICGHSWHDHLLLRWPTKGSALDTYLDAKQSLTIKEKESWNSNKESRNDHRRAKSSLSKQKSFHRNYVTDREQLKPRQRRGPLMRQKRDMNKEDEMEWRECKGVFYSIPKLKDTTRKKKGWGWCLAYELVLGSLEDLIAIEKL